MLRHVVRGLIVALLMLPAAAGAPAYAQSSGDCPADGQYPPSTGTLETSSSTVRAGGTITVGGSGFTPGSSVNIDLDGTRLATVTVDDDCTFEATVTIPEATVLGTHTLRATGTGTAGGPRVLAATIQVVGGADGGADLPRTGSSSTTPLVAAGVGMVLLGSAALVTARRRRVASAER